MAAHAGIFCFDRQTVSRHAIDTLIDACRPYGPDAESHKSPSPDIVLISLALQVTPEDQFEQQPVTLSDGRVLTWDGRLDNRFDLKSELGLPASRSIPDSQVVASACERWGDEAFPRLTGDWSVAIWNPRERYVTLACDFMSVRRLYYVVTKTFGAWSTALAGLVTLTGRQTDFDDDYLQALVIPFLLPGRSPYRGIVPLTAGHLVRLDGSTEPASKRFWHLAAHTIRYRDQRDYAAHLRSVVQTAVANRLRSTRPVWMQLSGGWDSSVVVCVASNLLREANVGCATDVSTVSFTIPDNPECDEERFIDAASEQTGLTSLKFPLRHAWPPSFPVPTYPQEVNPAVIRSYARMRETGARVLLTGVFGDGVMGNSDVDVTDITWAIRLRQPLALIRALRAWGLGSQRTAWHLLWMACSELLPERFEIARLYREFISTQREPGESTDSPAAHHLKARGYALYKRIVEQQVRSCREEEKPYVSRSLIRALEYCALIGRMVSMPEADGLVMTHPLADRRLVDYMGSIPWSVVCEPGRPRALMRAAFAPILPPLIARRFSKGYAVPFFSRYAAAVKPVLSNRERIPLVVQRGYVTESALARRLEAVDAGPSAGSMSLHALGVLEFWLTQMLVSRQPS